MYFRLWKFSWLGCPVGVIGLISLVHVHAANLPQNTAASNNAAAVMYRVAPTKKHPIFRTRFTGANTSAQIRGEGEFSASGSIEMSTPQHDSSKATRIDTNATANRIDADTSDSVSVDAAELTISAVYPWRTYRTVGRCGPLSHKINVKVA
jgi:hypothetical protein